MGSSSESKTTNSPPAWSAPGYKEAGQQAQNLYNSGTGGNTYQGSTVADLSGTTMQGVNALANAGANTDTSGSRPLFQGIGAGAGSVYDAAGQPSSAATNLSGMASGAYLDPANDPYYAQALKGALTTAGNGVQSQFSGAGRLGSAANTNALGTTLGNIAVNAASQQYNQNVANMLGANQQIDAAKQAGLGTQLGALGAGQNAATSIAGLDQNQFQNNLTGAQAIQQAGSTLDTQSQKQLNDLVNLFYANDNQDWNRLGMFEQALAGASGNYGTQTARTSSSNPLAAAGGLISAIPKG
ncbi:MAG: hypothetical protein ACTHJQ_22650 [Rhizobiaceae bacterium]